SVYVRFLLSAYSLSFFNATATTEIYTLSLHDALPICAVHFIDAGVDVPPRLQRHREQTAAGLLLNLDHRVVVEGHAQTPQLGIGDRKSTRLNSSHGSISYAVFCLKKKKITNTTQHTDT